MFAIAIALNIPKNYHGNGLIIFCMKIYQNLKKNHYLKWTHRLLGPDYRVATHSTLYLTKFWTHHTNF